MINDLGLSLTRVEARFAGECIFCPGEPKAPPTQPMLTVESEESFIALCEFHEGELLAILLNNYVKRKNRRSKAGFTGDIPKSEGECV